MDKDLQDALQSFEERAKNPQDGSCEIDLTSPVTPEQVLAIIEAHTEFEKRMNTNSYVELSGPMTVEEVKLAVDKLRDEYRKNN